MIRAALVVGLALVGCSSTKTAPRPDAKPPGPSFHDDVLPVLVKTCASTKGCHGEEPADDVTMDLRASTAYGELVNKPAEMRKGGMRVVPHAPSQSFLVDKLHGQLGGHEGKRMPLDPDSGATADPDPLPPGYVDRILIPWIQAGTWND
jgi:hypothetical protein